MKTRETILEWTENAELSSPVKLSIAEEIPFSEETEVCLCSARTLLPLSNAASHPWRIRLEFEIAESRESGSVLVLLDDRPLGRWISCPESGEGVFQPEPFLLSSGEHSIRFLFENGLQELPVKKIRLSAIPVSHQELVESFPFDLYQRYEAVREILETLYASTKDRSSLQILDYGGLMGGSVGHMGSIADFLPSFPTVTADTRECRMPGFVRIRPGEFPFHDKEFPVIVCLDVLEHVPRPERKSFLQKLFRTSSDWVIVGCPLEDPFVGDAESALRTFIEHYTGHRHVFLEEHARFGLPSRQEISGMIRELGYEFRVLPNGYLPRWFWMQCVTFFASTAQNSALQEKINRFYNRYFYPLDKREPGYRCLFVVNVGQPDRMATWEGDFCLSKEEGVPPPHWSEEAHLLLELFQMKGWEEQRRKLHQLSAVLHDREKLILYQQNHIHNLEAEGLHRKQYLTHLETEKRSFDVQLSGLETHSRNLEAHTRNLENHTRELEAHLRNLEAHARNLEAHIRDLDRNQIEQSDRIHTLSSDLLHREYQSKEQQETIRRMEEQNHQLHHRLACPRLTDVLSSPWRWIRKWFSSLRK